MLYKCVILNLFSLSSYINLKPLSTTTGYALLYLFKSMKNGAISKMRQPSLVLRIYFSIALIDQFQTLMMIIFASSFDFQTIFQTTSIFCIAYSMRLVHRLLHLTGVVRDNVVLDNKSYPFNLFLRSYFNMAKNPRQPAHGGIKKAMMTYEAVKRVTAINRAKML